MQSSPPSSRAPLRILIANRGEIALRLQRTYALSLDPPIETVAIYTSAEKNAQHVRNAAVSVLLSGAGPRAYLDAPSLVRIAKEHGCWAVAPGYGFLSEDANFAALLEQEGIVFLGPTSQHLRQLGDKIQARALAQQLGVPVLEASKGSDKDGASSLEEIQAFASDLGVGSKVILKAAAGGGGRGIRIVDILPDASQTRADIETNYRACQREAEMSFGDGRILAERFLARAKHIELQLLGDGKGGAIHLWERECSLQRRNQKLIEIAPSPSIDDRLRGRLIASALDMVKGIQYRSLATFEFLVSTSPGDEGRFYFMEANPRIQVEHTVTEQVTGHDLVALQLQIGLGRSVDELGVPQPPPRPRCTSIQLRINAESLRSDGFAQPEAGELSSFHIPTGPHVRTDTAAHGPSAQLGGRYTVSPLFDSLLAKLIVTAPDFTSALRLADRALAETEIRGCKTNKNFLRALLQHPIVEQAKATTATVQEEMEKLYTATVRLQKDEDAIVAAEVGADGASSTDARKLETQPAPEGTEAITVPLTGVLLELKASEGDVVKAGDELAIIEAMKMEHVVRAPHSGRVHSVVVSPSSGAGGTAVSAGQTLLFLSSDADGDAPSDGMSSLEAGPAAKLTDEQLDMPRPELAQLRERKRYNSDASRSAAVAKRHSQGYLSPREVISLLFDADSLQEYGDLVVAAQRARHGFQHLLERTQGDGIITGWATVHGAAVAVAMADYLVLAGTQGYYHHLKLDRIFASVLESPSPNPLVFFAEGGGGRPGDTDVPVVAGLNTPSFALLGQIRARGIPIIGVANGYVFAGNAALLGVCDVVVATRGGDPAVAAQHSGNAGEKRKLGTTSIGMGGAAMIEGGGLGRFTSDEIGPPAMHYANGGVDVLVATEREAVEVVQRLLSLLTTPRLPQSAWSYSKDVRQLRFAVPPVSQRKRSYDVYALIAGVFDDGSFLEIGAGWGASLVTGFARCEGRVVAVLASRSSSALSGAIDAYSALKASRFLALLTRLQMGPSHLVTLCDTPGFMVGPAFESSANMGGSFRLFGDLFSSFSSFAAGGGRTLAIVVRNAYGLGAQALLGGSTLSNSLCVAWPTASFGAMGLEGAVRLGRRKELDAISDPKRREEQEKKWIDQLYERGRGEGMATAAEIDTVVDPAETRRWISAALQRAEAGARSRL